MRLFLCRANIYNKDRLWKPISVMQVEIKDIDVIALTEFFKGYPYMDGDNIIIKEPAIAKLRELFGRDSRAQVILDMLTTDGQYQVQLLVNRIGDPD